MAHVAESAAALQNRQRYVMDYEVVAIANALRVSVSWLYGESKNMR